MKLKSEYIKLNSNKRLYQLPVPILGLTGGIATGKSTVAELFENEMIPVINADLLVKDIYAQTEAYEFILNNFKKAIINKKIDFQVLRTIAFTNDESKTIIEEFIYERLPLSFMNAYEKFKDPELIVYDVPLLFEKKLDQLVDLSVCVYSPKETQLERLMRRDSIERELAEKIINTQLDIEDKKKSALFCINNIASLQDLKINFSYFKEKVLFNN